MNEIRELKRWLRIEGNSQAKLAATLGYKSSLTIQMWIYKNKIPSRQKAVVMAIIKESKDVGQGNEGQD